MDPNDANIRVGDLFIPRGQSGAGLAMLRRNRILGPLVEQEIRERTKYRPIGTVACEECVTTCQLDDIFRCYYCRRWYCEKCCPKHFGQTREAYMKEKENTDEQAKGVSVIKNPDKHKPAERWVAFRPNGTINFLWAAGPTKKKALANLLETERFQRIAGVDTAAQPDKVA